jgi:cytochrome c556
MRGGSLRIAVVVGSLAALAVGGCATGSDKMMRKVGSGDVVADRQRLMKLNGASWKDIQDKAKAGQVEAIAVNAETLALNAQHIPMLFPEGSRTDKSNAKPEIWQRRGEFESAAKNLETWAVRLRDASAKKDQAAVDAIVKDFGRQTCGTCHTPFRVPPKT